MNQTILLTPIDIAQKTVWLENIKATFTEQGENTFDVVLEINSNKFLINIQHIADEIQRFEIIAVKGFIELSNKIILTIKKLIEHLRYRAENRVENGGSEKTETVEHRKNRGIEN